MQNLVKLPSINSLQLRKLNKTLWSPPPTTEALPRVGSAVSTPNTTLWIQTHFSDIPLLWLSASKTNCPRSEEKFVP